MKWNDALKIVGVVLGIGLFLYSLDSRIKSVVEEKINNLNFVNKIAEKTKRPIVIFDQHRSVHVDSGAMKFIDDIKVVMEGKEPKRIIISPNRHLNVEPILESLDANYVIEAKRGTKFDWIYELSPIISITTESSAKPKEIKRFRLEIID